MTEETLQILSYISYIFPFIWFFIFLKIVSKKFKNILQKTEKMNVWNIPNYVFFRVFPALFVWIIFMIPFFYFIWLNWDFKHCKLIVEVNKKTITKENFFEKEKKCSRFDIKEFFE